MTSLPVVVSARPGRGRWSLGAAWLGRVAHGAAWLSLGLAFAALGLMLGGDPGHAGLPVAVMGLAAGVCAMRLGQGDHVATHIGLCLGVLNLGVWVLLVVVLQGAFGLDLSDLLVMPAHDH